MLKLALKTNDNKVPEDFMKEWIEGFQHEKNYKKVNTYIQNLMSHYWGEHGSIQAQDIFTELKEIDAEYGMELDLGKETWNRVVDYMVEMNNEQDLDNEWQEYFYGRN